jgi:hypothetical protein
MSCFLLITLVGECGSIVSDIEFMCFPGNYSNLRSSDIREELLLPDNRVAAAKEEAQHLPPLEIMTVDLQ